MEVVGEGVVEDPGADLEQEVRSSRRPPHLLLLDHALAPWLTVDSAKAVEIRSPARCSSPWLGMLGHADGADAEYGDDEGRKSNRDRACNLTPPAPTRFPTAFL